MSFGILSCRAESLAAPSGNTNGLRDAEDSSWLHIARSVCASFRTLQLCGHPTALYRKLKTNVAVCCNMLQYVAVCCSRQNLPGNSQASVVGGAGLVSGFLSFPAAIAMCTAILRSLGQQSSCNSGSYCSYG